ncbi:hypothetical protein [Actinomadura rubrisoli]|uniref:hypothetical protein n=1 Tax=Actinomadura rubrisoli TaxID=2530368 RepID=UPI001A9DA144|nr:hypothetical protein [Actinomadura rubrisoli]
MALQDGGAVMIEAAHYLVATGSTPLPGLAQAGHLTSTTAMELGRSPKPSAMLDP